MLQFVTAAGQKFADATEQVISDSTNYGPVGTTLALLEASTKFFSAIHKRLHYSQRQELRILARINFDFLPDEYPYDIANIEGQIFKSDFDGRIDIIPVSDPNVPSSSHRLAMAQMVMQMAQQAPQGMYNLREINRTMLDAAGIEHPDRFLIPEKKPQPLDPISDLNAVSQGMPIKAFPGQDHQAHITVKQAFLTDPTLGQNEMMAPLIPVIQANIREHMIMQYEEQMAGMLQNGVEQAGAGSPEAISQITQGAAKEILQNNQRMAEMGSVHDLERMTLDLQRQQLELEREKLKIDAAQKAANIALSEEKLDLEKDELEITAAEKLAKIKEVSRDRDILAENKIADRDDKFLIEMMKLLVKETGVTVEKLKEEVTLRPETFQAGGTTDIFSMIGDYATRSGKSIMEIIGNIFSPQPSKPLQADKEIVSPSILKKSQPELLHVPEEESLEEESLEEEIIELPSGPPIPKPHRVEVKKLIPTGKEFEKALDKEALDKKTRDLITPLNKITSQDDFESMVRERIDRKDERKDSNVFPDASPPPITTEILKPLQIPDYFGLSSTELRKRLAQAETGSYEDPYIFTTKKRDKRGRISSAFGPTQILYSTAEAVEKKYPTIINKNPEFKEYLEKFIQQGKHSFNVEKSGIIKENGKTIIANKDIKNTYGRGKKGNISDEAHRLYYPILEGLVIKMKMEENKPKSINQFLKAWLGSNIPKNYLERFNA